MSGTPQRLQSMSVPCSRVVHELARVLLDVDAGDADALLARFAFPPSECPPTHSGRSYWLIWYALGRSG